jgi:transketolase
MRRAFAETLYKLACDQEKLAFITGDLGFQVFDQFEKAFPQRYINVGVAEAQMVYVAAGMAAEGWRTVAYSIASFATARPFEQIRYCVAYPNLPVTLVGAGRGFTYATSGVSHHAVDDLALMTALPNMRVVIPGDPGEIEALFGQVVRGVGTTDGKPGPAYFTVGKFGEPRYDAEEPAVVGQARLLRAGKDVAVLSTGEMANEALLAYEMLKGKGLRPALYQFHTVKPLDVGALERISRDVGALVVVEEHMPNGGLFSAVAMWRATASTSVKMVRLGPPDRFALGSLELRELRRRMGYDAVAIAKLCEELMRGR